MEPEPVVAPQPVVKEIIVQDKIPANETVIDLDEDVTIIPAANNKKPVAPDRNSKMLPEDAEERVNRRREMMAKMQEKMLKQKLIPPQRETSEPKRAV